VIKSAASDGAALLYMGRRVDSLSRDELVAAVHHLARLLEAEHARGRQDLEVLASLSASPRRVNGG
jgi:hypothetical protein